MAVDVCVCVCVLMFRSRDSYTSFYDGMTSVIIQSRHGSNPEKFSLLMSPVLRLLT